MNRGLLIAAERVEFKETPGEKHASDRDSLRPQSLPRGVSDQDI
jgi:hypothetical protein